MNATAGVAVSDRNRARRFGSAVPAETVRAYVLLLPAIVALGLLLVTPLLGLIAISFWSQTGFTLDPTPTLANYAAIVRPSAKPTYFLGVPFYLENASYTILLIRSVLTSLAATFAAVILAYPMAYFLAFRVKRGKLAWIILVTVPFWTSYLLRVFAWKVILGYNGVINSGLMALGIVDEPLEVLLYNPAAVTITLAHAWAAFAILPIYVSLEKIDRSLLEAAADLGDGPVRRFFRITLPLSRPGLVAASLLIFIPTVGDYVTPALVGGTSGVMIGNLIQSLFGKSNNAPLGAAVAISSMAAIAALTLALIWPLHRRNRQPL
ncbi:MAG: ABC transporter permease [Pseudomonadota bacterium]|nr:ABC transporter permease [Pseudomonadota bacterium]